MKPIIYAVGDIHGSIRGLMGLYEDIHDFHARFYPDRDRQTFFLGDYIDRGPASKEVIDFLRSLDPNTHRFLKGNHEDMCLSAHGRGPTGWGWAHNSGEETLVSFKGTIPSDYLDWMEKLEPAFETDKHIFVHAGLLPPFTLQQHLDGKMYDEMYWIRGEFLGSNHDWGKRVVHGHTPTKDGPDFKKNRVNVDTGGVFYGKFSAVVIDEEVTDLTTNQKLVTIQFYEQPVGPYAY